MDVGGGGAGRGGGQWRSLCLACIGVGPLTHWLALRSCRRWRRHRGGQRRLLCSARVGVGPLMSRLALLARRQRCQHRGVQQRLLRLARERRRRHGGEATALALLGSHRGWAADASARAARSPAVVPARGGQRRLLCSACKRTVHHHGNHIASLKHTKHE